MVAKAEVRRLVWKQDWGTEEGAGGWAAVACLFPRRPHSLAQPYQRKWEPDSVSPYTQPWPSKPHKDPGSNRVSRRPFLSYWHQSFSRNQKESFRTWYKDKTQEEATTKVTLLQRLKKTLLKGHHTTDCKAQMCRNDTDSCHLLPCCLLISTCHDSSLPRYLLGALN